VWVNEVLATNGGLRHFVAWEGRYDLRKDAAFAIRAFAYPEQTAKNATVTVASAGLNVST
jgi:hypothetical protein